MPPWHRSSTCGYGFVFLFSHPTHSCLAAGDGCVSLESPESQRTSQFSSTPMAKISRFETKDGSYWLMERFGTHGKTPRSETGGVWPRLFRPFGTHGKTPRSETAKPAISPPPSFGTHGKTPRSETYNRYNRYDNRSVPMAKRPGPKPSAITVPTAMRSVPMAKRPGPKLLYGLT